MPRVLSLAVWSLLVVAALALLQQRLVLGSDMQFFLPPAASPLQQQALDQLQAGASSQILLLAIEAGEEAEAAGLSRALAESLRGDTAFREVLNRPEALPEEEAGRWRAYRYLLSDAALGFDASALQQALEARLDELASPLAALLREDLAADPTAHYRHWLATWQQSGDGPQLRHGVWFTADGRALLLLRSALPTYDLDAQQAALAQIHAQFAALADETEASLLVTGPAALAVASRDTIRAELQWLSLLASGAVALLLLWAWRSPRLWLLAALPLGSAILAGLSVTLLLFGQVHGITLAFGITLLGVALDYPLHLFSHLRPNQPPGQALGKVWPRLRLGALSTATGYLAMLGSGFPGLMQLGVFAASGLLAAALVTRYVLPQLLPAQGQGLRAPRGPLLPTLRQPTVARRQGVVLSLALASLAWLLLSPQPLWQQDVAALSPLPAADRQQEGELRRALGQGELNQMLLLQGESAEELLQRSESLQFSLEDWREQGVLAGYQLPSDYLPSRATQRARQQALPTTAALSAALAEAQQGLPFRAGAFAPFVEQVAASRTLTPLTPADLGDSLLALRLAPLLFERDGQWWAVVQLQGLNDPLPLSELAAAQAQLHYLDLASETGAMLASLREAALRWLVLGALLIALILWWGLGRQWRALGEVLLPVGAALLATLATVHLLGELIAIFHLVALLLVLGLGIDYGLFFRREGQQTAGPREAGQPAWAATSRALALCAISSLLVFAILSLSAMPVLHAIGLTVSLGVLYSFLFAWFLAPVADPCHASDNNDRTSAQP